MSIAIVENGTTNACELEGAKIARRRRWTAGGPPAPEVLVHDEGWRTRSRLVMVQRERRSGGRVQMETVCFIASMPPGAE
jgi:hypothetical protein